MWDSLLVSLRPPTAALRTAISRVFRVAPEDVRVLEDNSEDKPEASAPRVVVSMTSVLGDFAVMMDVYCDPELEARGSLDALAGVCRELGVSVFTGADFEDPASGYVVTTTGEVRLAAIDLDAEDRGVYRLTSTNRQ